MPRLAAMSRNRTPGSCAMHSSTRAWLVRKPQLSVATFFLLQFWKSFASLLQLVWRLKHASRVSHRLAATYPGLPEEAMLRRPDHQDRYGQGARIAADPAGCRGVS